MKLSIFLLLSFCYLVQSFEEVKDSNVCHQCYGDNGLCNNENDQGHFASCSLDGLTDAYCASVTQVSNGGENSYYKGCAADFPEGELVSRTYQLDVF